MKKRFYLIAIITSLLSLFSCSPAPEEYTLILRGNVSIDSSSNNTSRTVFHKIDVTNLEIIIIAEDTTNANYKTEEKVSSTGSFALKLQGEGPWKISAIAYNSEDASKKVLFKNTNNILISLSDIFAGRSINIILSSTSEESNTNYNISLPIKVDNSMISKMTVKCDELSSFTFEKVFNDVTNECIFQMNNLTSGLYTLHFTFYSKSLPNPFIIYECSEIINVSGFENEIRWVNTGNCDYLQDINGVTVMNIDSDCISNFIGSFFYVSNKVNGFSEPENGYPCGTYVRPFNSLVAAIDFATTYNTGNTYYFLIKDSIVEEINTNENIHITEGKKYNILPYGDNTVKLINNSTIPLFTVDEGASLVIKGITLDGNKEITEVSNSRILENKGSTVFTDVTIQNCKSNSEATTGKNAGIIKNYGDILLDSCLIGSTGISPSRTTDSYNCEGYDCLINNDSGNFTVNNTIIRGCKVFKSESDNIDRDGSSIICNKNGTVIISGDSRINYCTSISQYYDYVYSPEENSGIIYSNGGKIQISDEIEISDCFTYSIPSDTVYGNCTTITLNSSAKMYLSGKPILGFINIDSSAYVYLQNMTGTPELIAKLLAAEDRDWGTGVFNTYAIQAMDAQSSHCDVYFDLRNSLHHIEPSGTIVYEF